MISEPLENVLKRDRVVVTTALAVLTALAWLYVLRLAANMGSETQIAGMPAMPGMPLARRGLENDSAPCEQVRRPTGDAALDVLVERSQLWRIPL